MWHQRINRNFMKLWEYRLCANKTKIILFNNFSSSVSVFNTCWWKYQDACVWCCWNRSRSSEVEPGCAAPCLQAEECTRMCHGTVANVCRRLMKEKKLLNKAVHFVVFAHKKYSRSFITLQLNHWCHMDYFNDVLTSFLGLECGSSIAVYAGQKALGFH